MTQRFTVRLVATALLSLALGSCRDTSRPAEPAAAAPGTPPAATSSGPAVASQPAPPAEPPKKQGHEHVAPHGGTLIELGDEFAHVEIVLDRTSGMVTAFVLDGEAERPIRITQAALRIRLTSPETRTLGLTGRANPLTGERSGDTSEFTVTDAALKTSTTVAGTIVEIAVRGSTFSEVPFALQP